MLSFIMRPQRVSWDKIFLAGISSPSFVVANLPFLCKSSPFLANPLLLSWKCFKLGGIKFVRPCNQHGLWVLRREARITEFFLVVFLVFCWAGSFNVPCSADEHIAKPTSSIKMNYVPQNFDGCKIFANLFEPWQHNRRHPWLVNPDEVVLF